MRILYCNKYNFAFSGTEAYLLELMPFMRLYGHEVALFSMADARGECTAYDHDFVPPVNFKDPRHSFIDKVRMASRAIYSREARVRIRRVIQNFRPDVAHVRNIYHHLTPSVLWELKAQGIPVLYHLNDFKLLCPSYNMVARGHACEGCRGGQYWRVITEGCYPGARSTALVLAAEAYFHTWIRTYDKCVDRFLAPSQFVRDKLITRGWDAGKIEVLHHFQKPAEPCPTPGPNQAPVLYFGRLSPEKGVADLLRAMRRLPHIRLQIAGEGPQRAELEALAQQLALRNVEFLGYIPPDSLEKVIAAASFTILPSRAYETLGKSILESYAQARPVIASDLGSRRELVREGKTGLLYPVGDVEQLAGAISFLYQRPGHAAEMGAAGYELVRTQHAPEAHCRALTRLYQEMAAQHCQGNRRAVAAGLKVAFIGGRGLVSMYSGIESYYEEVGRELVARGHQVTVYCRTYFTPKVPSHHGMRIVRIPTIRSKHLETLIHTLFSTAHVLTTDCNIVHYHALGPALFSFLPRLFGKKTVVTVQGLDWQRTKWGRVAAAVLRLGEQAAICFPDATMVVSRTLQTYYRTQYGVETFFVPNGAIMREPLPASRILDWRLEPDNYILFLGRLSPEKNCHMLIDAYERVETSAKLVMAGGSSYSYEYIRDLRSHESDNVRFLDWVTGDCLQELLTNAMLFVLPSDLEGLSLALLDAMGAGLCVLTSDIEENSEVVDGVGFTFRRGEVADLARMLRLLIADPSVRHGTGLAARRRVAEQYQWPQIAAEVEKVYRMMMGQKLEVPAGTKPSSNAEHVTRSA